MLRNLFLLLLLGSVHFLAAQSGCPGCVVDLPVLPADTIFLGTAPAGEASRYYDEDLSFRLPKSTTPVNATDPSIPAGLNIDEITILAVAGLPPGLSWEASQLIFPVQEETDGCVKFCGTPLLPGLYTIEVVIEARISFITTQTAIAFPLLIEPAQSIGEGFTLVNSTGCGTVTASFINNIPSGGNPGFSYLWFFGNGNATTAENPEDQTFSSPGEYAVNYEAIVDTAGFFMTQVVISQTPCTDLLTRPDLKFDLFGPDGEYVFTAPIVSNATLPITYQVFIPIEEGNYELHVIDDDGGIDGADDLCGIINFNRTLSGPLSAGDLLVDITLIHPVDTIRTVDTITVYEIPAQPSLVIETEAPYCAGTTLQLAASYADGLTWYQDSMLVVAATGPNLTVDQAGSYWVTYTSPAGCQATAAPVTVAFSPNPSPFTLSQNGNLLRMTDEGNLPQDFSFNWLYAGEPIPAATSLLLCAEAAGNYTLIILDNNTGCSALATIAAEYDPNLACSTPVEDPIESETWRLYPNPVQNFLYVDGPALKPITLVLYDAFGRIVAQQMLLPDNARLELGFLPAGMYFYQLQAASGQTEKTGMLIKS
ncbi:MAG: hypothetical protein DA408_03315 [Bacteroidetes bacterium]|nr:MAG: hypothetical protein C7N36_00535 [Bacteroidota bacterium]PTM14315.1 MAG: hypothetical protein DA408_03315 [Bacteroidota bacterium]